jgi:ATP-dependent phosphofructokinase / diphosphate-dependent phosphofructokinase
VLATQYGAHAVRLIVERKFGRMVTYQPPDLLDAPIIDAIKLEVVCPNCSAVQAARALGICFGDNYQEPPFRCPDDSEAAMKNGGADLCSLPLPLPTSP